jgi:hypothetical protein
MRYEIERGRRRVERERGEGERRKERRQEGERRCKRGGLCCLYATY